MREQIQRMREIQNQIERLNNQLAEIQKPTLNDTSLLPDIYNLISTHKLTRNASVRELRLCFVIVVVYLYSPRSAESRQPMRAGLRHAISKVISRCPTEVSEMLAEAKFRHDRLDGFREKIEAISLDMVKNI